MGNHEFDEGYKELQRLQTGGCLDDGDGENNQNSCAAGTFAGADFHYLAANVIVRRAPSKTDPAGVLDQELRRRQDRLHRHDPEGHARPSSPRPASPGLEFNDEVETANALVPELRKQGRQGDRRAHPPGRHPGRAEVDRSRRQGLRRQRDLRLHLRQGRQPDRRLGHPADRGRASTRRSTWSSPGTPTSPTSATCRTPAASSGWSPRRRPSAGSFTETDLKYDTPHRRHRARLGRGHQHGRRRATSPRPPTRPQLIDRLQDPGRADREQGARPDHRPTSPAPRTPPASPPLGDLIADAQLNDASVVTGGKTPVVAFMNPGGIRADLTYKGGAEGDGVVTYEEAFTVQPFNNYLVSMDLTGAAHPRPAAAAVDRQQRRHRAARPCRCPPA